MLVTKRTVAISGMSAGYEATCQRMLWKGVAWLAEANPPLEMWRRARQSPRIVGLIAIDGDHLKALEAAMLAGEDDVSGAQCQAVLNHLATIHLNGVDGWLRMAARQTPGRVFTWTGDLLPEVTS